MTATQLVINSEKSLIAAIEQTLSGQYRSNESINLSFNGWPNLTINVKGDKYNSTVTNAMMKSFIELQTHFNKVYAEIVLGKSPNELTADERKSIELIFKVTEGSSGISSGLENLFSEIGKGAMEKLSGNQVLVLVLGIAFLWIGNSAFSSYTQNELKTLTEQNRHKMELKLMDLVPTLENVDKLQKGALLKIIKGVSDAEQVTIGDNTLSKSEIQYISQNQILEKEEKRIDGLYKITGLKVKTESFRMDVHNEQTGESFVTELRKDVLLSSDLQSIIAAIASESAIRLKVVGKVSANGTITSAKILGVIDDVIAKK